MKHEKIVNKTTSYGLNVSGGNIDSLRVKDDLKTVIRVYDDGKIGIAGRIGEGDDKALFADAKARLSQNITYPCDLTAGKTRKENCVKNIVPATEFVKTMKKLLARLNKEYPDFIFSNKINMEEYSSVYENSENTRYEYASNYLAVILVIQHKKSASIMDLAYGAVQNYYDEDKVVSDIGKLLAPFDKKAELDDTLPVIIGDNIIHYSLRHIIAELYMSGASLFNGKLGEKLFDEKVNIYLDRGPDNKECIPFFDSEGVVNDGDKFYFIKDGVFNGLLTYKRTAHNFNLPLSGGGYSDFDEVPVAAAVGTKLGTTSDSLKKLIQGKAIYIVEAGGGDMTPDGTLGIPVQLAYLYDNGELVGKLPEFSLNANIFDLLGKDLIGVAKNDVFGFMEDTVLAAKFKINKN